MQNYEIILLIDPSYGAKLPSILNKHLKPSIEAHKFVLQGLENWGMRKLAYPIKNLHRAYYVLLHIKGDASCTKDLEYSLNIDKTVIRHKVMKTEEGFIPSSMIDLPLSIKLAEEVKKQYEQ